MSLRKGVKLIFTCTLLCMLLDSSNCLFITIVTKHLEAHQNSSKICFKSHTKHYLSLLAAQAASWPGLRTAFAHPLLSHLSPDCARRSELLPSRKTRRDRCRSAEEHPQSSEHIQFGSDHPYQKHGWGFISNPRILKTNT